MSDVTKDEYILLEINTKEKHSEIIHTEISSRQQESEDEPSGDSPALAVSKLSVFWLVKNKLNSQWVSFFCPESGDKIGQVKLKISFMKDRQLSPKKISRSSSNFDSSSNASFIESDQTSISNCST